MTDIPNAINSDSSYNYAVLDREMDKVKSQLFLDSSAAFLAPLMCSMEFRWSEEIPTAGTNGLEIIWNPKDFLELTFGGRVSTLLHEIWHSANLTFIRAEERDPRDWNIATDYEINNNLKADGYEIESPWFLHDTAYKGMCAEQIYEIVHQQSQCAPWGPGSLPGDPGNGGGQPLPGDRNSGTDMLPGLTPEQQQQVLNNVIMAANHATLSGNPGAIPGNIQEVIKKILKSVVPWDRLLDRFLDEKIQDDYTWSLPDRRYQDIYLPSMDSDDRLTHLIFYFDVSGSITQAIADRCFAEIHHIKKKYNPEKLTLVQFDTRLTKEEVYTEDDPFNELVIVGRGGTSLVPVRKHMMDHNPTAAVVFSDLLVTPMQAGPKNPILWIAVDNKLAQVPFGQLIRIKP